MSVFICTNYHIDLLASAISWYVPRRDWPQGYGIDYTSEVAQLLLDENLCSYADRYKEQVEDIDHEFIQVNVTHMTLGYIWKQLDCYKYQACESNTWENSVAKRFCDALASSLKYQVDGYESAPWGEIERPRIAGDTGPVSIMDMIPKKGK